MTAIATKNMQINLSNTMKYIEFIEKDPAATLPHLRGCLMH